MRHTLHFHPNSRWPLIFISLLLPAASPALASCFDYCASLCQKDSGDLDRNTCGVRCTNACVDDGNGHYRFTGTVPPLSTQHFGAIALSPSTLAFGQAAGYATSAEAEAEALRQCQATTPHPGDCRTELAFTDTCAALAVYDKTPAPGGFWGTAWAPNAQDAQDKALATCRVLAPKPCKIATQLCHTARP